MNFQKLTPISDAENIVYNDALDYVFDNDDVCNVAISGAYSAGKSSVIETYKKEHPEKHFLHISLAHFEKSDNQLLDDSVDENVLEGKILNQLIQQVDPSKIPQTNFRIKREYAVFKKVWFAVGCVALVLLIIYVINFTKWVSYVADLPECFLKAILAFFTTNQYSRLIGLIAAAALVGLGIYTLINIQLNKGLFKKLSVQGNEIEIFEDNDESYFDKYLNEVLYLFEKSEADVVVFEDIDRFNSVEIFQRLREINTLVNRKQGRRIRFFYLLRDDVFVSKDRTKFFDFMIPVVPVVDSSNSFAWLSKMLASEEDRFDQNFLQSVSLYIDDMRILKNICNEYQIYKSRIGTIEQDENKLLAIIIYKNIFPRDFSELQLNRGFVYHVFSYKDKFIQDEEARIEREIKADSEKLEQFNGEVLKNKTEIERLYSYNEYHKYNDSYYGLKAEYEAEKQERINNLEEKLNGGVDLLQNRIEELRAEKVAVQDKKLSKIITRDNIDVVFSAETYEEEKAQEFQNITQSDYFDLLKYLIRNGHIDETYLDYMSYFYPHSLSRTDKVFLRSITDQKAKEYQYSLSDPQKIVERLRNIDFRSEEIRNYDLLDYLLTHYNKDHIYIANFTKCLRDTEALDFVFGYIDRNKELKKFTEALCTYWSEVFDAVAAAAEYSDSQRKRLALLIVYYAGDMLPSVDEHHSLSDYINHNADFLDIDQPDVESILKSFEVLDVRFADIYFNHVNHELSDAVYQHDMYEINEVMIGNILEYMYGIERSEDYQHKNLTLICTRMDSALFRYIDVNMDRYIEQYIGFCKEEICDDEDIVPMVLDHEEITDENKDNYLKYLSTKVSDLGFVKALKWQTMLLSRDLAVCSMDNILEYFFAGEKKINETLYEFINRNTLTNDLHSDITAYDFVQISAAFNAFVKCDYLEDENYRQLVQAFHRYYQSFNIKNISINHIYILIDLRIIRIKDKDVLLFMREEYPGQIISLIEKNIKDYCKVIDAEIVDTQETIAVLDSKVRLSYKMKVLSYTDAPISVKNKGYQEKLVLHLLKHNFDENDLPFLVSDYENYSEECKAVIFELMIDNVDTVIDEMYPISYQLLIALINQQSFSPEVLFELFSISVARYDIAQTKECLTRLNRGDYLSLFDKKHPKFPATTVNKRVLDTFQRNGLISSYSVEDGEYRAYGKK